MIELALNRFMTDDEGTFGTLTLPENVQLFSAELPWRGNLPDISCIPTGTYYAVWSPSPRFGWGYQLINVPGRTLIRIHIGNWAGDKSKELKSDVEGCILLGSDIREDGHGQKMLTDSADAVKLFHKVMDRQFFKLKVVNHC